MTQPSRPDIVQANVTVYEETAESYRAVRETYLPAMREWMRGFLAYLRERGAQAVIDVGSGSGIHTQIVSEVGIQVTAIDASPKMLQIVKDNVPTAICEVADFWTYEPKQKFDGVILASFIHLFPKEDLPKVIARVNSWMNPGALGWIATVVDEQPHDGMWMEKEENHGRIKRWRVVYAEEELVTLLKMCGLTVKERIHTPDGLHADKKLWLDLIVSFPGSPA